jgi:C_GCAxxG_C_C family probable redox protein
MEKGRSEILEEAFHKAKQHELKSGGCAQCTIAGIFETLGVKDEGVFKAATGLADGVGLTGDGHCGALSGGAMAISYFFGRSLTEFDDMMKQVRACLLAKKLHDQFVDEHGTCRCRDIQEKTFGRFFNLYDPKEMEASVKAGMPDKCSTLVGETARMAVAIILDERERLEKKASKS